MRGLTNCSGSVSHTVTPQACNCDSHFGAERLHIGDALVTCGWSCAQTSRQGETGSYARRASKRLTLAEMLAIPVATGAQPRLRHLPPEHHVQPQRSARVHRYAAHGANGGAQRLCD